MNYLKLKPEENTYNLLMVDITHRCNMECANCYLPNRIIPDMDINKLYSFIKRLPSRTIIRLIGAEPTMRKDLFDIIKQIKKLGHNVSVTTNGLKLSSLNYVKKLKQAGLRMILLSMNGADDPNYYEILDSGSIYTKMKVDALENCFKQNMLVNTGTILIRGVNEDCLFKQVDLVRKKIKETNYKNRIKPILRFKSVAKLGRYMETEGFSIIELEDMLKYYVKDVSLINIKESPNHATLSSFYETDEVYIRLVDWTQDDDGVPDANNEKRGRITQEWKIAPFFEHVKENEFGY